jgi:hypothetical protein
VLLFQGLAPFAFCCAVALFTFQAVTQYKVVVFVSSTNEPEGNSESSIHDTISRMAKQKRVAGKWTRQMALTDAECTYHMRFLMLFSTAFNDCK